jgi:hypothetical protein
MIQHGCDRERQQERYRNHTGKSKDPRKKSVGIVCLEWSAEPLAARCRSSASIGPQSGAAAMTDDPVENIGSATITVGAGRGFIVQGARDRLVCTPAHRLPFSRRVILFVEQ